MSKKVLTYITAFASIGIVATVALSHQNTNGFSFKQTSATNSLILNSSLDTGAGASFGNGSFESITSAGNVVEWEYNYAKSNDGGLITLGKNKLGIADPSSFYVGNIDPITSITSITVSGLAAGDSLLVYTSHDGTQYYKMDVLDNSYSTFTTANGYQFFRLVNGKQTTESVSISSISINYDCLSADNTDEKSDVTSRSILSGGEYASYYETSYYDVRNSNQSMKIARSDGTNSAVFIVDLGRTIPVDELSRFNVEFYVNSESNSAFDEGHNYTRFLIYPATGTTRNKNGKYIQTANFNNGQDWTKFTYNLGSIADLKEGETYNSLYIKEVYVNGFILLDQFRIYINDSYPEIDSGLYDTYETDDISNTPVHYGYGTVTSGVSTSVISENSIQSSLITIDSNYRMWYYEGSHADEDATGMTVSFDLYFTDFTDGKTKANVTYQYMYNDAGELHKYVTPELNSLSVGETTKGITVTDLGNGFKRFVIDFDVNRAATADSAETSTNHGFNVGYARTIYVDNFFIL